jgi:serine/threonine protein kinase
MGVVWRARDQLLDRDVAVKEVHVADTLTDAERANAYQRTLREAKTAARLNHPAVVTVYDVCEDEGRPWIVMQLVHAQSLDQLLAASGPLPPRRAAEMGRQLLSALSVAHAAGVMHRDVKPSNVLLGTDDRAVLTDFGIATFQGDPKLTQTGMVMGSPGFTAPERIRGEDASPASDLWSLGATIYAAIEGHGPFEKRGGAIAALLRREPADRPDASTAARMITEVLPQLPGRPPGSQAGYEATARSASSRPGSPQPGPGQPGPGQPGPGSPGSGQPGPGSPGSGPPGPVPPRPPRPSETSLDFASAEPTIVKDSLGSAAVSTGPPAGAQASAAQTAPTVPQPVQGGAPRHDSPGSNWGPGAGAGYAAGAAPTSGVPPEGPPPDFSSWYGPSPRSGPAAQPGFGSAQAVQPGYGPSAWSGSASQPPVGPAPWSGSGPGYTPPPRQRSGLWWKIAIVALVIIGAGAGAATVVLLHRNNSGSQNGSTTTGAGSGSAARLPSAQNAPQIVNAINVPANGPLPSGFTTFSHPAAANETAGFSIAEPSGWKETTSGFQTYLKDPAHQNTNILIDLTPHTYPDMLREAQYIERRSIPRFPGYQRVNLARLTIRGQPGAFWKFTWNDAGVPQTAIDLLYVAQTSAGPQSYALYMTAPTNLFDQMRPTFDEEVETFATAPS